LRTPRLGETHNMADTISVATVDLSPDQPVFADGVMDIQISGGNYWFSLYLNRPDGSGGFTRCIVCKLVVSIEGSRDAALEVFRQLPASARQTLVANAASLQ